MDNFRFTLKAALASVWATSAVLASVWSCGGGDAGSGGSGGSIPDAAADSSLGGSGGTQATGGKGGTGGSGALDSGSDADDGSTPVVAAQAASYTLELGGQVDQVLAGVSPPDAAYTFVVVSGPKNGELLHVEAVTGRFVYTSITLGSDSFDFAIQKGGQTVDSATITLTTGPLDFVGDWKLHPIGGSCPDYTFSVKELDAGVLSIAPLMSACLKKVGNTTLPGGGTTTTTLEPQALGANGCVTDIANLYYCHAFRYWRITSRDDFQSIETVGGSVTIGGTPYVISGSVRGSVRRATDSGARAAVSALNTPVINVGTSDGTPKKQTLTLENKGSLVATLGAVTLPAQVTLEGGYPGAGGTCGPTLGPGATCTVLLSVVPTLPTSGNTESVPLAVHFSDTAGFDVTRLSVSWTWKSPADAAAD